MSGFALVPVAIGELYDKISILEIKLARVSDAGKLTNISRELKELKKIAENLDIERSPQFPKLYSELKEVNEAIWDAENVVREHERRGIFDENFIKTARTTYGNNDKRATIKRTLSIIGGSLFLEEKSHEV